MIITLLLTASAVSAQEETPATADTPAVGAQPETTPGVAIENVRNELSIATPDYIDLAYHNALESFYRQDYEGALVYIRHVIRADMSNYKLRYLAAHAHWKQGNFGPAAIHFQHAISAQPENPGPYIDYCLLMIHQRKYSQGLSVANRGLQYFEQKKLDIPSKLYNVTARLHLLQGNPAEALIFAEKAKGAFDQNTGIKDKLESMILEARAQLALKQYDKAVFALEWALSLKPENPYVENLLGYTYASWSEEARKNGDDRAAEFQQKATEHYTRAKNSSKVSGFQEIVQENIDALPPAP